MEQLLAPMTSEEIQSERFSAESLFKMNAERARISALSGDISTVIMICAMFFAFLDANLYAVSAVLLFGSLMAASMLCKNRFYSLSDDASSKLLKFSDLDSTSGDLCVKYLAWCEEDPDLRAYQNIIGKMGRMPIHLDYENAEDWINSRGRRSVQVLAKEACKRLAGWSAC